MSPKQLYDRNAAVAYAHKWAYSRNPAYYNYDKLGGDCTNFASQCLFEGARVMNFKPLYGWYYNSANDKSPSWTGVRFLYDFLGRSAGGGRWRRCAERATGARGPRATSPSWTPRSARPTR